MCRPIYLAFFVLLSTSVHAQSIERSTINAGGKSVDVGTIHISSSIGEAFSGTKNGTSLIVTQGFQQPSFLTNEVPALGLEDISILIEVYPNPAKDFVNLRRIDESLDESSLRVYNLTGQVQVVPVTINQEIQLDIRSLAKGEYFIRLVRNDQFAIFKLLKIN